ncbi:radial spoke protein 3 [Trypanosoma equiperdum]|uniref:Radial spoke protein 3, putative n=4 Tax=Trypanozoon TaxID=39700 RepID=Q387D7_TRYB2|nr:radial spoke protein 3 [Trypanosoma brucei gambiense DAL972]XP_828206.1 radial spoke protein 3, putative [Trypanosoma brucei brucei TREU927]RHW67684.1 radial spoke protein 3 [Trypanosoma brucei equiperdum]SCU71377.1 radial spoke protein 3 [Trypanosoma equiperdum]EAN79094.1 radial spoke protein 3, putative [Trypanosoma brucei brucei TREU927]CBH17006.1 radial spoke protein 3 [Trypanosoma brucei gambiense DAL972]|eukprot:XP_011779270.1 radial spoke protein 3 [Trypanosoma brucei gambiense DAL972]
MQGQNQAAVDGTMAYTFQHPPQGFLHAQYRDPHSSVGRKQYANIMHDRRVYRGNTYAAVPMSTYARDEEERVVREANRRRKELQQRATSIKRRKELDAAQRKLATPPPVVGRQHIEVQTEEFLEELKDEVEVVQQETQTDPLLDRPATPPYVPVKSGRDAESQINEGDLFHFDDAVDPILDVMVGKTLEQAMLEVLQEEELELLRQQQLEFEQRRKEELLEAQRLEAREKRLFEEKERRKKQEIERIKREKATREKLQARQFAKMYLMNLENRVFARLQDEGWFRDRVLHEVEFDFFPWLMDQVAVELEKKQRARVLVDDLIRQVVAIQLNS